MKFPLHASPNQGENMNFDNIPRINLANELKWNSYLSFRFIYAAIKRGDHIIKTVMQIGEHNTEDEILKQELEHKIAGSGMKVEILREGYLRFYETHHYNAGKKVEICLYGGFHRKMPACGAIAQILEARIPEIE